MSGYLILFYLFGAIQGFFLSVCLFAKRGKSGKMIALIVFLMSFDLLCEYLYWSNGWYDQWKMFVTGEVSLNEYRIVSAVRQSLEYLFGPMMFFYTASLSRHQLRRKLVFFHFVPAILCALIFAGSFYEPIFLRCDLFYMFDDRMVPRFASILLMLCICQIVAYLVASLLLIGQYRDRIVCFYSNTRDISLSWLALFIIFAFGTIGMTSVGLYLDYQRSQYAYLFIAGQFVAMSVAVYCIGFLALVRPKIYAQIHNQEIDTESADEVIPYKTGKAAHKYRKNYITDAKKREYLDAINTCMDEKRPYLDPDLTLGGFSEMTGIPTHSISQVINELLGRNFFHFVNHYRVEYARELLADPERGESIIAVCFRAGFNSKSVFNSVFKKHTGLTPSSFREARLDSQRAANRPAVGE